MTNLGTKKLFLIDGIGALVSALFLGVVLVWLEDRIGLPIKVLYFLAILPVFFAIYSFSCYFFKDNSKPFLKGIATLNLLYCFLTIGLLFLYDHNLTFLGWTYFIAELIVLVILIWLEFKASSKNTQG
ncbi:hypothetical protein FEE95_15840 [Maribacter algarum]|uniref:Uncharacterized protein n=1 Tax=Maribacter algarum (ex Zhang et al. 2020) TaxID=2578118 RepID=A0A5S3PNP8_9FLAO|nr:hypothetical protein [Maribacter algarum]TMM56102.1 hypothetical protein FEE95_15840 [Maribacter algarum]